ncbi:hypothetical protein ACX3U9_08255, partial [Corynebacterium pyruviciproducens]
MSVVLPDPPRHIAVARRATDSAMVHTYKGGTPPPSGKHSTFRAHPTLTGDDRCGESPPHHLMQEFLYLKQSSKIFQQLIHFALKEFP